MVATTALIGECRPACLPWSVPCRRKEAQPTLMRIEPAALADLPAAYRICLLTGDAGRDAGGIYRDPDLLGHIYVGPYLVHGQGTRLVLVDEAGLAGYLLATDDTIAFEAWAEDAWWPPLRARYPLLDDGSPDARLIGLIHQPRQTPRALAEEYPAHLHLDLLPRCQGTGTGRTLVDRLLRELREREVAGVHFGVDRRNTHAIGFYEHLGFRHLDDPAGVLMGIRLR